MIVVAIISLLAAIAIPNFLKFQCKSKQSEVKAGLGALFNSQKSFIGEHNTFGTDLIEVGWEPEGSPIYLFGFDDDEYPPTLAGSPTWTPARNDTGDPAVVTAAGYSTAKMKRLSDGSPLLAGDLPTTTCNGQFFIIGATGDINPSGDPINLDKWSLDSRRQFLNLPNDCRD